MVLFAATQERVLYQVFAIWNREKQFSTRVIVGCVVVATYFLALVNVTMLTFMLTVPNALRLASCV